MCTSVCYKRCIDFLSDKPILQFTLTPITVVGSLINVGMKRFSQQIQKGKVVIVRGESKNEEWFFSNYRTENENNVPVPNFHEERYTSFISSSSPGFLRTLYLRSIVRFLFLLENKTWTTSLSKTNSRMVTKRVLYIILIKQLKKCWNFSLNKWKE